MWLTEFDPVPDSTESLRSLTSFGLTSHIHHLILAWAGQTEFKFALNALSHRCLLVARTSLLSRILHLQRPSGRTGAARRRMKPVTQAVLDS